MAVHNANPLMKWLAGAAAVGALVYLFYPSSSGPDLAGIESGSKEAGSATVQHPNIGIGGESNLTDEVLNKLLGESTQLKQELAQERESNRKKLEELQKKLEAIDNKPNSPNMPSLPGTENSQMLSNLQKEILNLRSMISNSDNSDDKNNYDIGVSNNEYPVGISNVPKLNNPFGSSAGSNSGGMPPITDENGGWVEPMDQTTTKNARGEEESFLPELSPSKFFNNPIRRTQSSINRQLGTPGNGGKEETTLIPVYTIPADGTLVKAVTRTALLGRIPISGTVTAPYRFKLIVGSENLASNGHRIPGLHGMTISGTARGDYTLKCVSGDITSITYTFTDGTIRTVSSSEGNDSGGERLGYIADEQGVPCIAGKFISNAPEYLSQSIGADIFAAAAGAFADQEKVFRENSDGSTSSRVEGDPWINMGGEGLKAGANTASDWVKQRQQSAFDAIYSPTGTMVEVHLEKQIEIDYDTEGRKVAHHAKTNYGSNRGLD